MRFQAPSDELSDANNAKDKTVGKTMFSWMRSSFLTSVCNSREWLFNCKPCPQH